MTTSAVYDLIPNYDNTQHTQYPQGDKPEETLIQPPTNLQTSGETLTSVDTTWDMVEGYHTHFILQRWRLNTDTAWTEIEQPDEIDRAYTDSADLLEGQHVGYRIAASDGTNQSDWSSEAWTYVLTTATGGDPILQDDFSTYSVGTYLNDKTPAGSAPGARWTAARGDDPPRIVAGGYSGDANALGFRFVPRLDGSNPYAFSEQRGNLCATAGTALPEVWTEYYIYWPSELDYIENSHNKVYYLSSWQFGNNVDSHYGGDLWSNCETWPMNGTYTKFLMAQNPSMARNGSRQNWGHALEAWGTSPYDGGDFAGSNKFNPLSSSGIPFWDKDVDNGQWRRYRFHTKLATSKTTPDAMFEVWKDNTKVAEIKDSTFFDDNNIGFDGFYLFGWEVGIATSCVVKMGRFKTWSTDPDWSFS